MIYPTAKVSEQMNRKCNPNFKALHQPWALCRMMMVQKSCIKTKRHQKETSVWNC